MSSCNEASVDSRPPPPSYPPPPPPKAINDASTTIRMVHHVLIQDAMNRSGYYTGPLDSSTNKPHGSHGSMVYSTATNATTTNDSVNNDNSEPVILKYTGDWNQGHWQGHCENYTTAGGQVYTGPVHASLKHGDGGKLVGPVTQYQGSFFQDKKHGQGYMEWSTTADTIRHDNDDEPASQMYYRGEFRNDKREGYGTYASPNVSYVGDWLGNLYHGQGRYEYQNAHGQKVVYEGEFRKGKPDGTGKQTVNDKIQHEGTWRAGKPLLCNSSKDYIIVVENRKWRHHSTTATYRGLWNATTGLPHGNGTAEFETDGSNSNFIRYEGCFSQGQFHGHGRLHYSNGDVYTGDFDSNQRHGHGTYVWQDGRTYIGQFRKNQRHGSGTYSFANGDFYEGQFSCGKRHGHGRFMFVSGCLYEGNWQAGSYHGMGTLVHPTGKTYQGMFENGLEHGPGTALDARGNIIFQGEWVHGEPENNNQETQQEEKKVETTAEERHSIERASNDTASRPKNPEGETPTLESDQETQDPIVVPPPDVYIVSDNDDDDDNEKYQPECHAVVDQFVIDAQGNEGKYTGLVRSDDRQPHGVGRLVYADGKRIHEGFWKNGQKQGHGRCLFFPQGDFHEGNYEKNLRHGKGRYQWKDGRRFEGEYANDVRHGYGKFTYPTGERYEGMFENGRRSGQGKFYFDNGMYEGEWKSGKYHGRGKLKWGAGFTFAGSFANGVFHGSGVKKDPQGNVLKEGEWVNGEFQTEVEADAENARSSEKNVIVD